MSEKKSSLEITIFSTRFIENKEQDYLFNNTQKVPCKHLQNYYIRLDEIIDKLLSEKVSDEKKTIYVQFKTKLIEFSLGRALEKGEYESIVEGDAYEYVKRMGGRTGEELRPFMTSRDIQAYEDEDNDEDCFIIISDSIAADIKEHKRTDLKERCCQWNLEQQFISMFSDDRKEYYLYQVNNSQVYAVYCLEDEDKDNTGNRWIPCLIRCAQDITGNNPEVGLNINLVLHDKDLGEESEYAGIDVSYIDKDHVKNKKIDCDYEGFSALRDIDQCQILFFQHTTNGVVKILTSSVEDGNLIHNMVSDIMEQYGKLGEVVTASQNAMESETGVDESKKIDSEIIKLAKML